jgi:hypothetical protein
MRRIATTILSTIVGLALMLAAAGLVLVSTLAVADIRQPIAHALALAGELIFGTAVLAGATFLTTRTVVWFAGDGSLEGRRR